MASTQRYLGTAKSHHNPTQQGVERVGVQPIPQGILPGQLVIKGQNNGQWRL